MNRVGESIDIHKLVDNRKLILGGVEIPFEKGLLGHSDADVLIHAIAESILGALNLDDLGHLYPDDDPATLGISSMVILAKVYEIMDSKGFKIGNVDSLVIIEKPKLAPYIEKMQENIANCLHTSIDNINVKATCAEGLGFIGEGKGALASATCLLVSK